MFSRKMKNGIRSLLLLLAMSVAGVGHCALAAPHNNDFGEIINTGYAQGKTAFARCATVTDFCGSAL